jgi:hypothetical protein
LACSCTWNLAEPIRSFRQVLDRIELLAVVAVHVLDVPEPVVDQPELRGAHRGEHAAAAVVPAHDDVLHLQHLDRELEDGEAVHVRVDDDVAHVPMDEDLARDRSDDLVRRQTTVGAADPEELRPLHVRQPRKERRIPSGNLCRPLTVVLEPFPELGHRFSRAAVVSTISAQPAASEARPFEPAHDVRAGPHESAR